MDVRLSSLPAGGPMGGYYMGKSSKYPVGPQVTLNLSVHPPVLDTSGVKANSSYNFCGNTKRVGGNLWSSLRNVYNSMKCSGTWVNPHMVPHFQPMTVPQPYYPYPVAETSDQSSPLWYQANPGSTLTYEDPLEALACQYYNMGSPVYPPMYIPHQKNGLLKSSRPLNPEAEEWVPSNFRNIDSTSVPKSSFFSPDESVQKPVLIETSTCVGFVEITDQEIEEIRRDIENNTTIKSLDGAKNTSNINTSALRTESKESVTGHQGKLHIAREDCNVELPDCFTSNFVDFEEQGDNSKVIKESKGAVSYASIARKSPEPSSRPSVEGVSGKDCPSCEAVKQSLPKIFVKDKKYPKEKAAPLMETNHRDPLPFKTASKNQKKSSQQFLKDLRDLSPAKSDCSFSGSEGSLDSSSEFISRLVVNNSPSCASGFSPKDKSNCFLNGLVKNVKSQRSVSESSGSSCHNRTTSESSTGSVESVDIEFNDDSDIREKLENMSTGIVIETCKSKYPNNILSHILGLYDSESEDSDDETDDGDWDAVGECDSLVLDDSWETFGLVIPLITSSSPPCAKSSNNDLGHSEDVCDNDYNSSLDDINKRWNEEVSKDVQVASPSRVQFGKSSVHPMIAWSYAYKTSRRGPWEQCARDQARFNNRVLSLEPLISPVLDSQHRDAMYCKIYGC